MSRQSGDIHSESTRYQTICEGETTHVHSETTLKSDVDISDVGVDGVWNRISGGEALVC